MKISYTEIECVFVNRFHDSLAFNKFKDDYGSLSCIECRNDGVLIEFVSSDIGSNYQTINK